jgi:hypothetical protein
MFENTYPIVAIGKAFDGIGHSPLETYVRWEYRPGERAAVLAALRRVAPRLRGERAPPATRGATRPHGARRPLRRAARITGGSSRGALP